MKQLIGHLRKIVKLKQLGLYLLRWQLSTPILAIVITYTYDKLGSIGGTILANFIGGLIFYKVDKYIFREKDKNKGKKYEKENKINGK